MAVISRDLGIANKVCPTLYEWIEYPAQSASVLHPIFICMVLYRYLHTYLHVSFQNLK